MNIRFNIPGQRINSSSLPSVLGGGKNSPVEVVDSYDISNASLSPLISKREMEQASRSSRPQISPEIREKIDGLALRSPIDSVSGLSRNSRGGVKVNFELPNGGTQQLTIDPTRDKKEAVRLFPSSKDPRSQGPLTLNQSEVDYLTAKIEERLSIPMPEKQMSMSQRLLQQLEMIG